MHSPKIPSRTVLSPGIHTCRIRVELWTSLALLVRRSGLPSAVPSETLIVRTRSSTSLFGRISYTNHFDGRQFDRQMLRSFKFTQTRCWSRRWDLHRCLPGFYPVTWLQDGTLQAFSYR